MTAANPLAAYLPMLAIDTAHHRRPGNAATASAPVSGVALVHTAKNAPALAPVVHVIDQESCLTTVTAAQDLTAAIDRLTRRCAVAPDQIRSVVVNRGPGSWTGLRIGITAAKTLAFAANLPLIAPDALFIRTLAFILATTNHERLAERRLVVLQDSGHGQLTSAQYALPATPVPAWPAEHAAPAMHPIEALRETFPGRDGILIGMNDFPPKLRAPFDAAFPTLPPNWTAADAPLGPAATAMVGLAVARAACNLPPFNTGGGCPEVTVAAARRLIFTADLIHPLAPLYLKDPYAP